jgi:hypothetical protein
VRHTYSLNRGVNKIKTKIDITKSLMGLMVLAMPVVLFFGLKGASAATTYSLFGDASVVSGGNPGMAAQIRSDAAIAPGYGGVNVTPSSPISWASLTTLSTDYNVTNDNCGGGSPRFEIGVDTNNDGASDGNVRVAIGPSPSYTGCATGWQSTGNVIGSTDAGRYDYSMFGGSPFTTYSGAPASVTTGQVVSVTVVDDGSWNAPATGGDSEQTTLVDNINLNGDITTFELPTVKVTIDKYLDGSQATALSANSSSFPMVSTWNATNIGPGTGPYNLGPVGFNSPNPYEAVTSDMTQGADYTTNEVTGGQVVATTCTPGGAPYSLVGYTTGDTLVAAQTATPSLAIPAFTNLQNDKYVIVWNQSCTTPTNKDQCKNGGWQNFNAPSFKNQGQCVSWVEHNVLGHGTPAATKPSH